MLRSACAAGLQATQRIAARRFDLDDRGAHVREHAACGRHERPHRDFDDPEPGQRLVHAGIVRAFRHWSGAACFWPLRRITSINSRSSRCETEEHTSELQSLMRISYAVFCLKKKRSNRTTTH